MIDYQYTKINLVVLNYFRIFIVSKNQIMNKEIKVQLLQNKDLRKRVFLIVETSLIKRYVSLHDFEDWKKEMEEEGYKITIVD